MACSRIKLNYYLSFLDTFAGFGTGAAAVLRVNIVDVDVFKRVPERELINIVVKARADLDASADAFFGVGLVLRSERTVTACVKGVYPQGSGFIKNPWSVPTDGIVQNFFSEQGT